MGKMTKKIIMFCLAATVSLSFTSCGDKQTLPTDKQDNGTAQTAKSESLKTKAEKVSENLLKYTNSLGDPRILYLATLKNTDTVPLEFGDVTIDINDAENNLLKHVDFVSVYPRYVMPGEFGYICAECSELDRNINLDEVASAEMHFGTRKANYKKPDVEVTQVELKEGSYNWRILGKIKANEDIKELSIACPVFDADKNLQSVGLASIENLAAGQEKGFECSMIEYDENADFSASTVEVIPYIFN